MLLILPILDFKSFSTHIESIKSKNIQECLGIFSNTKEFLVIIQIVLLFVLSAQKINAYKKNVMSFAHNPLLTTVGKMYSKTQGEIFAWYITRKFGSGNKLAHQIAASKHEVNSIEYQREVKRVNNLFSILKGISSFENKEKRQIQIHEITGATFSDILLSYNLYLKEEEERQKKIINKTENRNTHFSDNKDFVYSEYTEGINFRHDKLQPEHQIKEILDLFASMESDAITRLSAEVQEWKARHDKLQELLLGIVYKDSGSEDLEKIRDCLNKITGKNN